MAEKKIGGRTFRVGTVLATDAVRLQVRLMKIIGGAVDRLPVILAGMGKKGAENPEAKSASDAAAVAALADIFTKADADEVATLVSDIIGMAQISTKAGAWETANLDQDFSGPQMKDLFPAVSFVLKEVLSDFFGGALASGSLNKLAGS
jgi:hypothetical protein